MSISAMLGSEPERTTQEPPSSSLFSRPPLSFGAGRPPAISPASAPARPASSLDESLYRRSQTPDKLFNNGQSPRPFHAGSGNGGQSQPPLSDSTRFGAGRASQPFSQVLDKPATSQPTTQPTSSEPPYNSSRRPSLNAPIPRPSSQPQNEEVRGSAFSPRSQSHRLPGYPDPENRPPPRFGGLFSDQARDQSERQRNGPNESDPKPSALGPFHPRFGANFADRESTRPSHLSPWAPPGSKPPSPELRRFPAPSESGSGFGFGSIQSYTKSLGSGGSRPSPQTGPTSGVSTQPQSKSTPPPNEQQQSMPGKVQNQQNRPAPTSVPASSQPTASGTSATSDEQRRKGSEELLQHRNLLGLGPDGKRAGRASPLPQAVQGAQAQIIGEPNIKGELGRVFSGIGSGVGTNLGSSASFKRDGISGRPDGAESSLMARKRSMKDEDGPSESNDQLYDGRTSALVARGGARRGRHLHHHHHQ